MERTFAWLGRNRRLSKDYEYVPDRAINFYQEVFGWQFEVGWEYDTPQGREKYWRVITGDGASAGINGGSLDVNTPANP